VVATSRQRRGFDRLSHGPLTWLRDLVLARTIEPTSTSDSLQALAAAGIEKCRQIGCIST
jgi:hypothetical protein